MSYDQLINDFAELFINFKDNILAFIPKLIVALFIVLIGAVIARLLQSLIKRLIIRFDKFIANRNFMSRFKSIRFDKSAVVLSRIVYWIVLIFFVTAATEVIGLPIVTTWLSGLVRYLPNILIAIIIIFLGILGGRLLSALIVSASASAGIQYASFLGKISQSIIIFLTILIAVDQVGIDLTILINVIDIVLAALLFGAALAFGLGARTAVSNILGAYYMQNQYREGQTIKIDEAQGKIIQLLPTCVILDTSNGQMVIPAKHFSEKVSILLKSEG